jgi:hypothetical protein
MLQNYDPDIRMSWITAVNILLAASYSDISLSLSSAPCFPNGRFGFPTDGLRAFVVVHVRYFPNLIIHAWSYYRNSRKCVVESTKISLSLTINLEINCLLTSVF